LADWNTSRKHRQTWGQVVLSAFVLSWLSVSLQPCLMAMEMAPDQAMTIETGHSDHAAHPTSPDRMDADCEHCPPAVCAVAVSCDAAMSSACEPDVQYSPESRRTNLVLKDLPADPPVSIAPTIGIATSTDHNIVLPCVHASSHAPGVQPLLNLLNCVFLI
jgi:hypothetical protein